MVEVNLVRGEVAVSLGDLELVLVPSFDRVARVEAALGRSLVQAAQEIGDGRGLTAKELVGVLDILARSPKPDREKIADAVVAAGIFTALGAVQPLFLRVLLGGRSDASEDPTQAAA